MSQQQRVRTRYVHINSKHRQVTADDLAKMNIHLNVPMKNVLRCAVKSFTIANSMPNILDGENTLSWIELYKPLGSSNWSNKSFSIDIPPGYYTTEELLTVINYQIASLSTAEHQVIDEQPLGITFSQHNDNYTVSADFVHSGDGVKYFLPFFLGEGEPIWSKLGFSDSQIFNSKKHGNIEEGIDLVVADISSGGLVMKLNPAEQFQVVSHNPATLENPGGMYIVSEKLTSGSTYETRINPTSKHTEARPQSILEWINFDVGRYFWIQHKPPVLHYHYLDGAEVRDFDISIESQSRRLLSFKEGIGEFNLVLVFETLDVQEYTPEFNQKYNARGYDIMHEPQSIKLR